MRVYYDVDSACVFARHLFGKPCRSAARAAALVAKVAHRHYGVDACAAQYVYLLFGCLRFVCKRHAA